MLCCRFLVRTASLLAAIAVVLASQDVLAENSLTVGSAIAAPNSTVSVDVMASHDLEVHGFSLALTIPTGVTLSGIDYAGTAVETALVGGEPEFSEISQQGSQVTIGVIFSLMPTQPTGIPATPVVPGNLIGKLQLEVAVTAIPGTYDLLLSDGIGSPPVNNAFTSAGQTLVPALSSGTLTIDNPFVFRVRPVAVDPGESVDVIIECDNEVALDGMVISILYDNSSLTRVSLFSGAASCLTPVDYSALVSCLDLGMALSPESVENVTVVEQNNVLPGRNFVSFGVVYDFCPPFDGQLLPAGESQSLMRLRFNVSPVAVVGNTANISFTNDYPLAGPIENLAIFNEGNGTTPELIDGVVSFGVTPPVGILFKRGDSSGDGAVGLPDAITTLNYLFGGATPPGCLDTADSNDDGSITLTDVIALLNFLFTSGCPLPEPGADCGIDGDDSDTLGCLDYGAC